MSDTVTDMNNSYVQHAMINNDIDTMTTAATALECYHELLIRGIDSGGVSRETAEAISVGVEQYNTMLGINEVIDDGTPSLEAFGGSGSRLEATKRLAEAALEKIKKLVAFIKGAFKALMASAKVLWQKINVAGVALKERADKVAAKAAKLDADTKKKDTITVKGSILFADGVFVGNHYGSMQAIVDLITKDIPSNISKYITDYAVYLEKVAGDLTSLDNRTSYPSTGLTLNLPGFESFHDQDADRWIGFNITRSRLLPDNKRIYIYKPVDHEDARSAPGLGVRKFFAKTAKLSIGVDSEAEKPPSSYEVDVAPPSGMATRAKHIAKFAQIVIDSSRNQSELESSIRRVDTAVKKLEGIAADLAKSEDKDSQRHLFDLQVMINGAGHTTNLQSEVPNGNAYLVRVLNAMLAVVERQMAQYA